MSLFGVTRRTAEPGCLRFFVVCRGRIAMTPEDCSYDVDALVLFVGVAQHRNCRPPLGTVDYVSAAFIGTGAGRLFRRPLVVSQASEAVPMLCCK